MENLKVYGCGPTVYDNSHLGHARNYITTDLIIRTLRCHMNKNVRFVMNITDIDDKIIKKALETKQDWQEVAKKYEESFFEDMRKLNINYPDVIIRVSEVLSDIVEFIQTIIDNGFAYITEDGSVYFDSHSYVEKGYLLNYDEDEDYSEVSKTILQQKKNKQDFALWKGRSDTDIGFDVLYKYDGKTIESRGRPGWHIECSVMIHKTLGPDIDIHFGGIDLKFPHHYNERIQANAYYHPKFLPNNNLVWSPTFYHIGHLCIQGQKMSKSLKNFTSINEALKITSANQLRLMFMLHKWTDQMDFSDTALIQAKSLDQTIVNFVKRTQTYPFDRQYVKWNDDENNLDIFY
jgi:cysteinyl-tRNA synthetase